MDHAQVKSWLTFAAVVVPIVRKNKVRANHSNCVATGRIFDDNYNVVINVEDNRGPNQYCSALCYFQFSYCYIHYNDIIFSGVISTDYLVSHY